MAVDLAELGISVRSDGVLVANKRLKEMERQSGKTEKASERMARQFQDVGRQLKRLAVVGGAAMAALSANSLRLAIDAEETANKFRVVFRGSVEDANRRLVELTNTIPLTITQMRGMAAGIQDMLVPMGVARKEAAGMSVDMIELAGDLASFNNVPTTRVLEAMQSALAGSSEPMRRFGVDTRVTRLEQIALRDGLIGANKEMDNAAMAAATMTAILEDSTDAIGDAGRTVGSTANQLRFMRRNFNQIQEDLGQQLLPAFNDLLRALNNSEDGMSSLDRMARGLTSTVLIIAGGVSMLAAGFVTLGKRMGQVAAIGSEIQEAFSFDFELSDLWTPGTGLAKLVDGLREGSDNAEGLKNRIQAINEAANEDIEESQTGIFQMFDAFMEGASALRGEMDRTLTEAESLSRGVDRLAESEEEAGEAAKKAKEAQEEWRRELDLLEGELSGPLAKANVEFEQAIEDINKRFADGEGDVKQWARAINLARMALEHARRDALSDADGLGFGMFDAALEGMDAIADKMREMQDLEFDFENLIDSFHPLAQEMRRLGDAIDVVNENIEKGNIGQMEAMFVKSGAAANAMFGAMMSGVNRTSKEYENLQKAQQLINVALGIAAILQQGMGDPYTAIPRMVAMAAMVASLGVNTGRLSGGGAARRQETQGTGTVLGDAEAKSESIVNATEITADATSTLVGINRGMLKALQQLQSGIAGASGMLARGARTTEFGDLPGFVDNPFKSIFEGIHNFIFDPLGLFGDLFGGIFDFLGEFDIIGKFLGGSSKVVDQGIQIVGGTIGDLIDDVMVRAFQEVRYKKWKFGSTKRKTEFEDLDEGIADQFSLIFEAIADSVFEGALALGLAEEDIRAAMETFVIETQRISLMDLTAEEQQAELEAVFGAIFDDLAGHVVPFIGQFQRVGEGLGETLARVASSVQVVEEAIRRLGFQAERTGAEQFAQLSVALVEASGGLDEFIEGMSSFIQHFAPEAHQLSIIGQSLASAFEQVGLALPRTREELWNLMQTLDANTEAGREQIATLLELAGMADAYYSALEDATRDYANAVQGVEEALVLDGLSDFQREMVGIQRELMQTVDAMNSAARAAGLQGAREEDLARAHELAAIRAQQAIARLESQAEEWVGELFGTSLSAITAQVNEAQAAFESLQSQLQQLSDFADSLLIGQFSPLPSGERLAEAMAQLEAASAAGDVSGVQSIAQTVLQIARDRFASGQQFTDIFNQVQDIIRGTDPADSIQGVSIISAPGLAPLLRQQSQLEQEAEDRREQLLANDIAQAVADLAMATGDSFEDVATRLGFDLQDLGDVLGLDERELADFIESLQVDTGDIATHLETLGDRIVAAILEGRDIQNAIDDRSADSRTGGLAGDPIDERDIDSRFGGLAGERDVESITDSQGETTRAVENASRDIVGALETPEERAELLSLVRRIADQQDSRSGGRNVRTRSAA